MGAIMGPMPTPEPPPAVVPAKPAAKQPMRTMLGGGFEGIADLVRAAETGARLPSEPPSAVAHAPPSAVADPASLLDAAPAPLPIAPPVASSTAGLPRSPFASPSAPTIEPAPPANSLRAAEVEDLTVREGLGIAPPVSPVGPTLDGMPPPNVAPLVAGPPVAPASVAPAPVMATIAGVAPPVVGAAPAPAPSAARARTMLGMAVPTIGAVPPSTGPAPSPAVEPVPSPFSAAPSAPNAAPSPSPQAGPSPSPQAAPSPEPPAVAAEQPSKRAAALGPSNRTMLGVAAPGRASLGAPPPAFGAAPEPAAQAPTPMPQVAMPYAPTSTGDLSIAGLPSPRRRARGWFFALLLVGVMLVSVVIVAALFYRLTRARADVVASVGSAATGEVLHVAVTGAPEGTHARFSGVDLPVGPGGVDFPLTAEALHVGDNAIAVDVVFPGGASETHQVTLTVEYRIHADLGSIGATPPAVTVVIDAVPGSTVVLDAQPFPLDAVGHGTRVCPIDGLVPAADGAIEHVAHYVISPPAPAVPAAGALTTRVPVVTVNIERPTDGAVTDRSSVELSGAVSPGSTLSVGGVPAEVTSEGRFVATVPLPALGDQELQVVASAPGRVTSSRTIHLRRVQDLAREAATFPIDRSLTYARIAAAPTSFQGQHVAIEGRVYNVDLQDGHGVLQLLARDCPSGERCPLWVTYPAVTDVTVESWVRVIGSVAGEQQFRSQAGEVRTVPYVDATFVLPARP